MSKDLGCKVRDPLGDRGKEVELEGWNRVAGPRAAWDQVEFSISYEVVMGNANPPKLLDQVRRAMRLRRFSLCVGQSSYAHGIMRFACHSSTAPHNKVSIGCALDEITVEAFV